MASGAPATPEGDGFGQPPAIGPGPSPLLPRHLLDLFVRPRSFFSRRLGLGHKPNVLLVTWVYGISSAIDRIDTELMRSQLGSPRPGWQAMAPFVTGSWTGFWLWVLAAGALGGAALWWIGGWWYGVRLRWSGVADPDRRLARLTLVYSSFVFAGPAVVAALVQTFLYPDYATAYVAEEWFSLVLLVFPFWSIATSYTGVTTLFPVVRRKAVV